MRNYVVKCETGTIIKPIFGEESGLAERAAKIIMETLGQYTNLDKVHEASLIVDARLSNERGGLSPAECVMKAAVKDVRDERVCGIAEWRSMRRAAKSIDQLLNWPDSIYNRGQETLSPVVVLNGGPSLSIANNGIWVQGDYVVLQLTSSFGCMIFSFQPILTRRDKFLRRRIARAMTHAAAAVITNLAVEGAGIERNVGMLCNAYDIEARGKAKEVCRRWEEYGKKAE